MHEKYTRHLVIDEITDVRFITAGNGSRERGARICGELWAKQWKENRRQEKLLKKEAAQQKRLQGKKV